MAPSARPTFLFIGTAKAGSSWIFEVLREHPQIFIPEAKDLHFFDKHFDKGFDWYREFFSGGGEAVASGEISHDYLSSPEAPARIHHTLPGVKLFACLREPVDKTISAFIFNQSTHLSRTAKLKAYAFSPWIMNHNNYYNGLLRYYQIFPKENILVLFYDELRKDPASFIRTIYTFLGVDPGFSPPSLHKTVLPAQDPRVLALAHFVYRMGLLARKLGLSNLVGIAKRSRLVNSVLYRPAKHKPAFPPDLKEEYVHHFATDYDKLGQLIGRPVPKAWYQP